ncbi:hypothetical protein Droror1_Dr00020762 [Drosera rotundifolia]
MARAVAAASGFAVSRVCLPGLKLANDECKQQRTRWWKHGVMVAASGARWCRVHAFSVPFTLPFTAPPPPCHHHRVITAPPPPLRVWFHLRR